MFYDEYDYEYEIFSILSSAWHPWASASLAGKLDSRRHSSGNKRLEVRGFVILRLEDDLTSSNKDNRAKFFWRKLKLNLVLADVLVQESNGL